MTATIVATPFIDVAAPRIPMASPLKKRVVSEDTVATEPATKKRRCSTTKKRVRFQSQIDVSHFDKIENKIDVWYSKDEFREGRIRDRQMMHYSAEMTQSFRQTLTHLVACTTHANVVPDDQAATYAAHSPFRGNEHEMLPYFCQRRKHVIGNVLKSQKSMITWKKSNPEKASKADSILAGHYQKLTAPAKQFARLLAAGDALVACS